MDGRSSLSSTTGCDVFACKCLNVRVSVSKVENQNDHTSCLEDLSGLLECHLDSTGIKTSVEKLTEIKTGSSIDPNIQVLSCLFCSTPVLYFRCHSPPSSATKEAPAPGSMVYLPECVRCPESVLQAMESAEYSDHFQILMQGKRVDQAKPRSSIHIPFDMRKGMMQYLQREEEKKEARIKDFVKAQEDAFESLRRRVWSEGSVMTEIINAVCPASPATLEPVRRGSVGSSGLAAMLRGSDIAPISRPQRGGGIGQMMGGLRIAEERSAAGRGGGIGYGLGDDDLLNDDLGDLEQSEADFGRFDESDMGAEHHQQQQALGIVGAGVGIGGSGSRQQQQQPRGGPDPMVIGSLPMQIPMMGSGSVSGRSYNNRREYMPVNWHTERENMRRQEERARGIPQTFVPPHQVIEKYHKQQDLDQVIGSKPQDYDRLRHRWNPTG